MRTFHQDTDKTLASNLKTAAKNTMRAVVKGGKALSSGLHKGVIVAAATMVLAIPNTQAQGLLDRVLGGAEKVLAKVEKTAYDVGRPFYKFNRQFDRTQQAINYAESDIRGTEARVAGVAAPVVNIVNGIRNQRQASKLMEEMEAGQAGQIPLIAEEGQVQMVSPQNHNRAAAQTPSGLKVVGEVSLDKLTRGNTSVSATPVPSQGNTVSVSRAAGEITGEITLDQLEAYTQSHSTSRVRARQAEVQGQKSGDVVQKTTPQVKETNSKTNELLNKMIKEGYLEQ